MAGESSGVTRIRKIIGPSGGAIAVDGASLDFPPGALAADQEIHVSVLNRSDVAQLPAGVSFASAPVAFEPHGLKLNAPVSVMLGYDTAFHEDLLVAKLDDGDDDTWAAGPSAKAKDGKATFTLSSFSIWAVVHDPEGVLTRGANSGSGGTSTGGSGGQSTGGTGGLGGAGGASTGGAGGDEPGYLDAGAIAGFVREYSTAGVTLNSNVATAVSGEDYCASGTVLQAPAFTTSGGLEISLNETPAGVTGTFTPVLDGIELDVSWSVAATYRVTISDGTMSWCAALPLDTPTQFVRWSSFNTDCTLGASGDAYEKQPIGTLRVDVPSDASAAAPFDFCVASISDVPTGYYDNGTWAGYAFVDSTAGSTTGYDLSSHRPPDEFCITGSITEDTFGTGMIAFNLDQPPEGGPLGARAGVTPSANYLVLDVTNTGTAPADVVLFDGTTHWCQSLPSAPPPLALGWAAFTNCADGVAEYDGEPILWLGVRAKGQALVPVSFNVCVAELSESNTP